MVPAKKKKAFLNFGFYQFAPYLNSQDNTNRKWHETNWKIVSSYNQEIPS